MQLLRQVSALPSESVKEAPVSSLVPPASEVIFNVVLSKFAAAALACAALYWSRGRSRRKRRTVFTPASSTDVGETVALANQCRLLSASTPVSKVAGMSPSCGTISGYASTYGVGYFSANVCWAPLALRTVTCR